jgi:hypothetical protein
VSHDFPLLAVDSSIKDGDQDLISGYRSRSLWLYGKNPIQIPFKLPSDEDDEEPELDDEDLSAPSEPAPVPSSGGTSGKGDVPPIEDLTLEEDGGEESAAVKTPTKLAPSGSFLPPSQSPLEAFTLSKTTDPISFFTSS